MAGQPDPANRGASRRKFVRITAPDSLTGSLVGRNLPLAIRDVSTGGIAAVAREALPVNSKHILRLEFKGQLLTVHAHVAYCRPAGDSQPGLQYLIGFAFQGRAKPGGLTVDELIDQITSTYVSFSST